MDIQLRAKNQKNLKYPIPNKHRKRTEAQSYQYDKIFQNMVCRTKDEISDLVQKVPRFHKIENVNFFLENQTNK